VTESCIGDLAKISEKIATSEEKTDLYYHRSLVSKRYRLFSTALRDSGHVIRLVKDAQIMGEKGHMPCPETT
jgi:hypothetical protein